MFAALFWSSRWLGTTKPWGQFKKVRPIQSAVKLGCLHQRPLYKCPIKKHPRPSPDSNSSKCNHHAVVENPLKVLLIMWINSKHIYGGAIETSKQTWATWLPLWESLSSEDRVEEERRERGRRKKKNRDENKHHRRNRSHLELRMIDWKQWLTSLDRWMTGWLNWRALWLGESKCVLAAPTAWRERARLTNLAHVMSCWAVRWMECHAPLSA